VTPREWLEVVRTEYLEDFVRAGGAAVKVAVPVGEESKRELHAGLQQLAEGNGYHFAFAAATATKIHMIDKLFNSVAQQIDWDALTRAFLISLLVEQGLKLPPEPDQLTLAAIAAINDYPEPILRAEVHRWLGKAVLQDYALVREFRFAMLRLCLAQLDPTDDPGLEQSVKEWLRGDLRLISGLRRAQIYQRIARHNARPLLDSLVHWLRLGGKSGLVLGLDISRYAETTRPADRTDGLYYTTPAALDVYEVVRQFIDAADESQHCFIVVVVGPEFLHDERRGLRSYHALYLRVADEVRDRYRQNPLAALIRLESGGTSLPAPPRDGSEG